MHKRPYHNKLEESTPSPSSYHPFNTHTLTDEKRVHYKNSFHKIDEREGERVESIESSEAFFG